MPIKFHPLHLQQTYDVIFSRWRP